MRLRTLACLLGCLVLAGCATINIYVTFPQEKIESVAESFLMDLEQEPAPAAGGRSAAPVRRFWEPVALHAQSTISQPRMDSPVIEEMQQKMRGRLVGIRESKAAGRLGETREGLLDIRSVEGLNAAEATALRRLVQEENRDRTTLYREIVRHNNMPAAELAKVQVSFAAARERLARPGEWVQNKEGRWLRKPAEGE